jgi:hypothetical protein
MRRRLGIAAVVAALAVALTACTGLPSGGPVVPGLPAGAAAGPPAVSLLPDRPQPGATAQQIVAGFIRAGQGSSGGWETARLFLAPSFRDSWKPTAGVTVDVFNERSFAPDETDAPDKTDTIDLTVTPVASVDENGTYSVSPAGGAPLPVSFSLARQRDGQWRITKAPNGIILDESAFASVFHPYSLMYYDPTWTYLVPDVRWFPATNAASRIVQALIRQKRSAWLAGSVQSAFPDNVGVQPSVTNNAGTAQVELTGSPLSVEQTTLDRMLTQLSQSLATAGFSDVRMSFGSTPINASVILPTTNTPAQPVVLTAKGFGFYQSADATVDPLPGLGATVAQQQPNAIALAPDRQSAALRTSGGTVGAVLAGRAFAPLDTRPGLIAPSMDTRGFVWSVPAGDPTAVRALSAGGKGGAVGNAWPGVSRIGAMQVSADGTRLAALVVSGGHPALTVAGIVRDDSGVPVKLSDPVLVGILPGEGLDLAWLDDSTLGALAHDGDVITLVEQQVGGTAVQLDAPPNASSLSGASSIAGVRVRGEDGAIYERRGSNWQQVATGVQVLAHVQ